MRFSQLLRLAVVIPAVNAGAHVGLPLPVTGQVSSASSEIVKSALQTFCSSILGYTAPTTTITRTFTTTPTSTFDTFTFFETTTGTDYYVAVSTTYTTNALAKRAAATSTPAVLSKYPGSVVTSACSLVVPRSTVTVSTTSTAPAVVITSISTITIDIADYVPTATVTTTVGIDCGLRAAENLIGIRPPPGNGNARDGSGGIENCTIAQGQEFVQIQAFFLRSWSIGVRPNGLTYCDFYQTSARDVAGGGIVPGEAVFTYYDKPCVVAS